MSYCLLLQGADGSLRLLADASFATRSEALSALSVQAESGAVDTASDQVWLIDLNSVAPVVLVGRAPADAIPAMAPKVTPETNPVEQVEAAESEGTVMEAAAVSPVEPAWAAAAGLVPEAADMGADTAEEPAAAPEDVSPVDETPSDLQVELPEPGAVFEPNAAFAPAIDETVAEDTTHEVIVDSILDDLVLPEPDLGPQPVEEDSFSDLREALERSAAQMAAEGLAVATVAESLDVPVAVDLADSLDIECATVQESLEVSASDSVEAREGEPEATTESAVFEEVEQEVEPIAPAPEEAPVDLTAIEEISIETPEAAASDAVEEVAATEAQPETVPADEPVAGWPWAESLPVIDFDEDDATSGPIAEPAEAVVSQPDVEPVGFAEEQTEAEETLPQSGLQEAATEPMSVTSGDDTEVAFVGLGQEYTSLPTPHPSSDSVSQAAEAEAPEAKEVPESIDPSREVAGPQAAEPMPDVVATVDEDLIPGPSAFASEVVAPTTVDTPGYTPGSHSVADMTCGDCVWVDTCPNKDQRDPASCGSFQWK